MQTRGYSTAELLALRSVPLPPASTAGAGTVLSAPDLPNAMLPDAEYQALHRAVLLCHQATFAVYQNQSRHAQLVVPVPSQPVSSQQAHASLPQTAPRPPPPPTVRWCDDRAPFDVFAQGSRLARWLRYGRSVACFNLYPASKRDLQVNDLLWRVAHEGEYRPEEGNLLLENNVISLAMPHKFFSFLARISRQELKTCMLQVLALIAEDEDAEGLALMQSELEDSVWQDLTRYMANRGLQNPLIDSATEQGRNLMRDVEMLLTLCYLSPWKIDVYTGYITPHDMSIFLSEVQRAVSGAAGASISPQNVSDRKLVRSSARRPVSFVPMIRHGSPPPPRGKIKAKVMSKTKTTVFWKLFQDWRRYRRVLVQGLGRHPTEVTRAMLHSIAQGTQKKAWDSAEFVMACACQPGNLFSTLPREVVFNLIAPHLLLASSKL